jgi:hypothetical protein
MRADIINHVKPIQIRRSIIPENVMTLSFTVSDKMAGQIDHLKPEDKLTRSKLLKCKTFYSNNNT